MTGRERRRGEVRSPAAAARYEAPRSLERPVDELAPRQRPAPRPQTDQQRGPSPLRRLIGGRDALRRLMLLREVLGPPKGM
jgi:hypothetical protein